MRNTYKFLDRVVSDDESASIALIELKHFTFIFVYKKTLASDDESASIALIELKHFTFIFVYKKNISNNVFFETALFSRQPTLVTKQFRLFSETVFCCYNCLDLP